jgi:hypothetical protein
LRCIFGGRSFARRIGFDLSFSCPLAEGAYDYR